MAEPIKRAAKKVAKSAVAKKAPAKTIPTSPPTSPSPLAPRERKTPAFLNTPFRVAFAAISSLAVILAFAAGDYFGQFRHRSIVDQSIRQIIAGESQSLKKSELERAAIEAVLKATGDQWANYFPSKSVEIFNQTTDGRYSGIGVWLRKNQTGTIEVSSVQPNSPAAAAGLKTLDAIDAINGVATNGAQISTTIAALRGSPGSEVVIDFERSQVKKSVKVIRASVLNGDVEATQIAPGILYIQVSAFSSNISYDVSRALLKYDHKQGVILDLRDNPGGLLKEGVDLASLFLNEGVVVSYSRRGNSDRILSSTSKNAVTSPMTVLINKSTASAAEVVTGALQDRNRAVVLGEKSYGKGTVQELRDLYDGSQIEITVGKYRTPSGRIIDHVGITPDLVVPESQEIAKAIGVLGGLAALEAGKTSK
jgi:carboxyl-terminal processing protease